MLRQFLIIICTISFGLTNIVLAEQTSNVSGSNASERLSDAVKKQNMVLDDSAKAQIIENCQTAQQKIEAVKQQSNRAIVNRLEIYSGIQKDMQTIKLRMIRQGSDASETDLLTGKLQQLLDELTVQADKYGTTLSDLTTVKCQDNPEQFKAGLVLARAQRAQLLNISYEFKKIFDDADANTYHQLKKRLEL